MVVWWYSCGHGFVILSRCGCVFVVVPLCFGGGVLVFLWLFPNNFSYGVFANIGSGAVLGRLPSTDWEGSGASSESREGSGAGSERQVPEHSGQVSRL